MNYLAQRNKVAEKIAEVIFEHKPIVIRLEDESDCGVLEKIKGTESKYLRYQIINAYRDAVDNKFETEFDWSRMKEFGHDLYQQLYETVFDDLISDYSELIDGALWIIQCKFEPQKYKSEPLDYAV